jgi:hypothetical protein
MQTAISSLGNSLKREHTHKMAGTQDKTTKKNTSLGGLVVTVKVTEV